MDKCKILIVEDNEINALVLKRLIAPIAEPFHAINDNQAFQAVKDHTFSLILMDINLGGQSMDGEGIMKNLKADPRYSTLPIFAVTSYAMPGDEQRFLNAGFDAYFSKPINREKLLTGVKKVLQQQQVTGA